MRHQGWNGHRAKDAARDAAKNELAHAGMTVAAHDEQICRSIRGIGQDGAGDIDIPGYDAFYHHPGAMPGKVLGDVGAGNLVALCRLAGYDDDLAEARRADERQ